MPASDDESGIGGADPHCPGSCPDDMVPVDRCPTFPTLCEEVPDCDDTLICADPDDVAPNQANNGTGDVDCDKPISCPPGTEEVSACPDGAMCSHINLCDESLICREDPALCAEEPLCPDGERAVDDCEHEGCYAHHHCSGPVDCLPCSEELANGCPTDTIEVYSGYCDEVELPDDESASLRNGEETDNDGEETDNDGEDNDDENGDERQGAGEPGEDEDNDNDDEEQDPAPTVICQRVETCEATLHCAPPSSCIKDVACAEGMEKLDDCDEAERDCYTLPACSGPMACEAEEYDTGCDAEPKCPGYYEEAEVADCVSDFDNCVLKAACGQIMACLPEEE